MTLQPFDDFEISIESILSSNSNSNDNDDELKKFINLFDKTEGAVYYLLD